MPDFAGGGVEIAEGESGDGADVLSSAAGKSVGFNLRDGSYAYFGIAENTRSRRV